jgi:hypothetical protein
MHAVDADVERHIALKHAVLPVTLCCFCLQRNYRTFLMFIYSTSIYIAWTFGVSLGSLFVRHKELAAAVDPATQDSISSNLWLQTLGALYAASSGQSLLGSHVLFMWQRKCA